MLLINLIYCCMLSSTVLAAKQRSYDLTIERLHKVMVDDQFLDLGTLRATRVNRTHTVISGEIHSKVTIDDNVLVTILTYEKSGTEYKRSAAVSFKNKPICSFFNSDTLGINEFKATTNFPEKCPVPPGTYEVKNYVLDPDNFPAHIPGSYWRGDLTISQDDIQWGHIQVFVKIDHKRLFG